MRRAASLSLALALLCGACTPSPDGSRTESPAATSGAREWIAQQRLKAWALLESVAVLPFPSKPGPWHNEINTFADRESGPGPSAASASLSSALVLFDPVERQGVQTPMFPLYEATFYNDAAYKHIRMQGLYQEGSAAQLVAMKRRETTEFPEGSMVLKTFWRPVPTSSAPERQAFVGIWKWRQKHVNDDAERVDEAEWPTITGRDPECVVAEAPANGCLIADQHFVTARAADVSRLRCVQEGRCPEKIDEDQTLILVAFHIADKSLPDWFWATVWWKGVDRTTGSEWTCDNAQRPDSLSMGVWSYYSLDVGPSFRLPKPPIGSDMAACGTPGKIGTLEEEFLATYNPFVEGVVRLGRKSSCLDCHARASSSEINRRGEIPEVDWINRFYPDLRHFENHVRTDYLWTLSRYMGKTPEPSYPK
jgi:hypothetical protein